VYLPLSQSIAGFTRDAAFLVAARLSSAQIVVHAHGARYQEFYRRMPAAVRGLMRFAMGGVTGIIVLGEGQRGQFEGLAPRRARIEVVPNGVRDEWPDGPAVRGPKEGGTVLFLGNLRPQKGFLDVLDAVPVVLRALPATRFVFAGRPVGGAATAALVSRRLREPGIQDAVVFAGAVTAAERRQLLETADVLAFPPRWNEGQGLVALEAMSASVPLVVTSSGGLAETVRDGVEAIVVPRRDPQAVACALTRLLQDHQLRARMGAAARERFESKYTLERWLSRMRDAFGRMLDKAESA
jgi:glycosyltransferase involved in cell wall biosynthesis